MTHDQLINAYYNARDAYEAAKAGTGSRTETLTTFLVANTVLHARMGWVDQNFEHFRQHYSP